MSCMRCRTSSRRLRSAAESERCSQNGPQCGAIPISPSLSSAWRLKPDGGCQALAWLCIAAVMAPSWSKDASINFWSAVSAQHLGEQAAFGPARHAGEPLLAGGRDRHRDIVLAVARHHGLGDIDAGLGQRADPGPLGDQLLERVIARPVQAKHVSPAIAAVGHPEGDVLGERHQRQVLRLDRKGRRAPARAAGAKVRSTVSLSIEGLAVDVRHRRVEGGEEFLGVVAA